WSPFFVTADKGMSYHAWFEWACERGITLVAPYRPANHLAPAKAEATMHFDEHGVPYCRSCHGGTDQVGFTLKPAKSPREKPRPIIRVRCAAPQNARCAADPPQEWDCHRDPT